MKHRSLRLPFLPAANSPNLTPDLGRKLENAVLLTLRRMGIAPTFAAAPHEWECDFVTASQAIQCCARLTPENRQRELLVITLDQKDALTEQGLKIRVIPAWKWLD